MNARSRVGHDPTTVGVLLGMAAARLATSQAKGGLDCEIDARSLSTISKTQEESLQDGGSCIDTGARRLGGRRRLQDAVPPHSGTVKCRVRIFTKENNDDDSSGREKRVGILSLRILSLSLLLLSPRFRLPQPFAEMEVSAAAQAAAMSGVGLLYRGTAHRLMAEFLLGEISRRAPRDRSH